MTPALEVQIGAKLTSLFSGLNRAEREVKGFERTVDKSTDEIDRDFDNTGKSVNKFGTQANAVFKGVAAGLAAAFSVAALTNFTRSVFEMTGQFQKFQAVLKNTLGSEALADMNLKQLQDFAAVTPFGVNELTEAFVKLANQGFTPTIDQMRQLGDLASSTGKSFDQLAEAILDAQTGEYERLKEFGIRAKDAGDAVIFTFKGVATEVEKTSSAIREYITGLGDAEGVTGAMVAISETLEGQASNLADSWDQMLLSIGSNTSGVFNRTITLFDRMINKITEFNNRLNTADKYGIEGDFLQQLNRVFNPFADKGATDRELAVAAIRLAEDATSKYVNEVMKGAKSVEDFQNGIEHLWKLMADKRASGDARATINGVVDMYNNGVKALVDAQKQFEEAATRPGDANFGTVKGSEKKTTGKSDAEKAADEILKNEQRVQIAIREGRDKEIEQVRIRYEQLTDMAKGNAAMMIQIAEQEATELEGINRKYDQKALEEAKKWEERKWEAIFGAAEKAAKEQERNINKNIAKIQKEWEEMARKTYETQRYYAEQAGNAIGNALEDALASGENIFQALAREFKRMIIRMIADAVALKAANVFQGLISGSSGGGGGGGGNWWGWVKTAADWALKIWGGGGKGGGSSATSNFNSASPMSVNSMSANSFAGNPAIANSAGINIRVTGDLRGNGRDLNAVIKAAQIEENIYFGR